MSALLALVVCLSGGLSAVVGTIAALTILAVRRLYRSDANLTVSQLRSVWAASAAIGIPVLSGPVAGYVFARESVVIPYLYTTTLVVLTAGVSALIGTVVAMATIAVCRFVGFTVRPNAAPGAWLQMRVGWLVSIGIGLPVLTQPVSKLVATLANR